MAVDLSVFGRQKSIIDAQQLQQAFEAKKAQELAQLQKTQMGGDLPAPLQLANEYQKRIQAGDVQGANLLMQFAKTQDKGLQIDSNGQFQPLPGYGPAIGELAATKKGMETQAAKNVEAVMNPQIAGGVQNAKNSSDLRFALPTKQAESLGAGAGKAQAEAQAGLPAAETSAQLALDTIDNALKAPGLDDNFGLTGVVPNRPGSQASDAAAYLDQIKGQNFLNAYQSLRGGGQITEVEGAKAEAAALRMQKATSAKAFREAAQEYKAIIQKGLKSKRAVAEGVPFRSDSNVPLYQLPEYADPNEKIQIPQKPRKTIKWDELN